MQDRFEQDKQYLKSLLIHFNEHDKQTFIEWFKSRPNDRALRDIARDICEVGSQSLDTMKQIDLMLTLADLIPEFTNPLRVQAAHHFSMIGEHHAAEELFLEPSKSILNQAYLAVNALHDYSASPEKIHAYHTKLGEMIVQSASKFQLNINDKTPNRRLNIGILIDPLDERHVVYRFMGSILNVDTSQYALTFYDTDDKPSEATHKLLNRQQHSTICANTLEPEQLAQRIRDDKIDVLFDLGGYLNFKSCIKRMMVFAEHPAPVQITYIAYPNTTGLLKMDYRLVDNVTDPEEKTDPYYTEKLLRFTDKPFLCFTPDEEELTALIEEELPSEQNGFVTFGVLNHPRKFSEEFMLDLGKILQAVPNCKILFQDSKKWDNPENLQNLIKRLSKLCGLPIEELQTRIFSSPNAKNRIEFISKAVDIALDTYPYNGTTTDFDTLLACVPIVTRTVPKRHEANVTASILTHLNIPELMSSITHDSNEFIQAASALAQNIELRRSLRQNARLRSQLINSSLCDIKNHSENLWDLVRQTWLHYCQASLKDQLILANRLYWENLSDDHFKAALQEMHKENQPLTGGDFYNISLLAIIDNKPQTLIHCFAILPRRYCISIIENLFSLKAMPLVYALLDSSEFNKFNKTLVSYNAISVMKTLLKDEIYLKNCALSGELKALAQKALDLDMLEFFKVLIEDGGLNPNYFLRYAARGVKNLTIVKYLCHLKTSDINAQRNGETALTLAIEHHQNHVVQFLYEQKADFTISNNKGEAPIHIAINENGNLIDFFANNKITLDVRMSMPPYLSPIALAASQDKANLVTSLLAAGANYPPAADEWEQLKDDARKILQDSKASLTKQKTGSFFAHDKPNEDLDDYGASEDVNTLEAQRSF